MKDDKSLDTILEDISVILFITSFMLLSVGYLIKTFI